MNSPCLETPVAPKADGRDSLHIREAAHPIAGGLTGQVKVYDTLYSLNYGKVAPDATVVASVDPDGAFPTLFVYEKGDKLIDGTTVPNKRIGLYLGQVAALAANWNPEIGYLTEDGKTLLFNTINYAIGASSSAITLSIARDGNDIVVTYTGGILQSANLAAGPWNDETSASPLKIPPATSAKFFRVKGN
jgi:hypothetical protein